MGSLKPSGMERMFVSAAEHFREAGIDTVIVGQGADHPFQPQLAAAGYRTTAVPSLRTLAGAKAWAATLKTEQPDAIHIHTEGAFASSVLASKLALPKAPVIRTIHSYFKPAGKALLSRKAQGLAADRFVKDFVAVSPDVQAHEKEKFHRESELVFGWVENRFFDLREQRAAQYEDEASAVIVGNSSPIKNHVMALRAVRDSKLSLYFHGDESGATAEERAILDELEVAGRLLHRGISDPGPSLLKAAVFLIPSTHEGMSIALAEALVTGVPALVSNVPGLQWSGEFPNVVRVPTDQAAWNRALQLFSIPDYRAQIVPAPAPLDLSARRGAGQLVALYRNAVRATKTG